MHVSEGARRKKIVGVLDEFCNICHWIHCIFVEHHSHTLYQAQTHDLVDIVARVSTAERLQLISPYSSSGRDITICSDTGLGNPNRQAPPRFLHVVVCLRVSRFFTNWQRLQSSDGRSDWI